MLDVPIRHRSNMIGIICCEHRGNPGQWDPDEIVFAGALADLYGRAVSAKERADYENKLIEANQTLEQKVKDRTAELKDTLRSLESAREKLVQSEKMAALGNLVAGIAHEINTPLGIALTSVSNCKEELAGIYKDFESGELSEEGFRDFNNICSEGLNLAESSLFRAADLVQDFKRTSANQTSMDVERLSLDDYIPRVCNPLRPMLKKDNIQLKLDIHPDTTIITSPGIIAQLLTNLLSNAQRHGFHGYKNNGGNLITVGCYGVDDGVIISVSDNGKGIPASLHKKVFEPFYTTARDQGGPGLGLNILYNLVIQKLQGEVELISAPDEGTTFRLKIRPVSGELES